ncbi:MAG: PAS domain S-box protein [Desulfobacterales bacterium]|nr:PAS domain S-box protein [Desulfobacterales bacterium]
MTASKSPEELQQRIQDLEGQLKDCRSQLTTLREKAEAYRLMIENVPDMIWIMSAEKFELHYLSPSAEQMLGYTVEETLKKPFHEILTPESYEYVRQYFEKEVIQKIKRQIPPDANHKLEIAYLRKDGTTLWVEITARLIFGEKDEVKQIIGVSRDISSRISAQRALKKSEEKYRTLFEDSRDTIYITAKTGEFVDINPAGESLFGCSRNEIIGSNILDLYENPHERERFMRVIEAQGYVRDYSLRLLKKDGTSIDCLITATLWVGADDTIYGYQGIIRDVTLQKRYKEHLQHVQKMEAIGTLAGGIAHNFNNLLMAIQGNTSLMLMKTPAGDPDHKKLKTIERHIQYGSELSNQLLGFARGGQYQVKSLNPNPLIRMSAKMFSSTRKEITCHTRLEPDIWSVEVDPGQLEQVMMNLFINACQAMEDSGEIYIQTENVTLNEFQLAAFQAKPGDYVKISVTDTGSGMDEETRQKIFEPFFTTKKQGQGTGLGLSSVYGIVKHHGGYITVYSEIGRGSTFNIYLPTNKKAPEPESELPDTLSKGDETVLVIDDEKIIAETAQIMLEALGYTALTEESGQAAIAAYKQNKTQIDLVILDMIMPNMNGRETFESLKAVNPDIKVLLSSGYSIDGQATELLNLGCKGFIQKPFNLIELSKKVREVIDEI